MPRFGVSIYSISRKITAKEITPEQGIEQLAEMGSEVIEIVPFGIDLIGEPELANRLIDTSKKVGVQITNYSAGANFLQISDDEYEKEISGAIAHIDAAAKLGVSTVRMDCSGYRPPGSNVVEVFQQELPTIIKAYRHLCDYAKQYNITVLLENHGLHVNGSDRVRQVMAGIQRDNFGFQLDIGNFICVDDVPEIAVKKTLTFATTIHMKDFYVRPFHRHLDYSTGGWFGSVNGTYLRGAVFGQGDLDVYAILKLIKKSGYDGDIFIEFEGIEECGLGTKASLENLKRIYKEV